MFLIVDIAAAGLPQSNNLAAIRNALENAGVKFLDARQGRWAGGTTTGVAKMPSTDPTSSVITEQLTRALGEAVIRIWSNLPQDIQNHLFQEAVTSQGESIRSQLAVFLHDKHSRTADPLGKPRDMPEPDSLGG
jgi:hypothetical protein